MQQDKCGNSAVNAMNTKEWSAIEVTTGTFCERASNPLTWFPVELHIKVALRVVLHPHRDQILLDLKGRNSTKGQSTWEARQVESDQCDYPVFTHTTGVDFEECAAEQCRDQIMCWRIEIERGGEQTTRERRMRRGGRERERRGGGGCL